MGPIIVGPGPMPRAPDGALIIDYGAQAVWHMGVRYNPHGGGIKRFRVIAAILSAGKGVVRYPDLVEALWGDDEDGGPDGWRNYISTICALWRPVLAGFGISIRSIHGQGLLIEYDNAEQLRRTLAGHRHRSTQAATRWRDPGFRARRGTSIDGPVRPPRKTEPTFPGYFRA